ncbi:MAG: M28 family peptidase, partial [Saprospiraceae bacterium]|nr:M28 family peptidase [Saprospiraceae bacterium]
MSNTGSTLIRILGILLITTLWLGCGGDAETTEQPTEPAPASTAVQIPSFDRDSAYAFVAQQVAFGPRNPGSPGIVACRDWMAEKLEQYGATVIRQDFTARLYTGDQFPSVNIIGQFNPGKSQRILLAAHYDTRFMAEEDPDVGKRDAPIDGADDGGSGVGVLIEIARLISAHPIDIGIDIIFFDAEDQGQRGDGANE